MLGFSDIGLELNVENILNQVSDLALWRYYIGTNFTLGKTFKAQYREDDIPSFNIFESRNGRILGKDFSRDFTGDVFQYLQYVHRITFYEALVKVNLDFSLGLNYDKTKCGGITVSINSNPIKSIITEKQVKTPRKFEILRRLSNQSDLDYWNSYGITRDTLNKYNVWPIGRLFIDSKEAYIYKELDPAYAYYFPRSGHMKCYFPLRKERRFVGNISNDIDIQGYDQCNVKDDGGLLVLTKSMKDVMLFHEHGIDSMAIHGESQKFNKDFIRHVLKYYNRIISLYDRDISGMTGAKYLWKEYGIEPYFINKRYHSKDISDLFKEHGEGITRKTITEIIRDKSITI